MLALVIVAGVIGYRAIGAKTGEGAAVSTRAFAGGNGRGTGATAGKPGATEGATSDTRAGAGGAPAGNASAAARQAAPTSEAASEGSVADESAGTSGLLKMIGAIVGGFLVLGVYFVYRHAKAGAPSGD